MTVLSLQWLLARPRRSVAVTRPRRFSIVTRVPGPKRGPVPPRRRTYPDVLFADPVAVEDDARRMRHDALP